MRIRRAISILNCLIFAAVILSAQSDSRSKANTDERGTSIPTLYWNKEHDVHKWLMKNEASLNRGDGCTLAVSWMDDRKGLPSAVNEIVSFVLVPENEEITRVFRDTASESGLEVRVGARYLPSDLPSLSRLEIALALEGPAGGVFEEISRSEAGTVRYKNWKHLSVVKPVLAEHVRYRYVLSCENGRTFMSYLRHPAKHKVRTPK
jgi:hypothetical protein